MSTANSVLVESISKPQLRGLPSRKAVGAERLEKIRELATELLDQAESLDHENALAETSATVENLNLKAGVTFFDEVRRFEIGLITRALKLTGGKQNRRAKQLGLGTTTLHHQIKSYGIALTPP